KEEKLSKKTCGEAALERRAAPAEFSSQGEGEGMAFSSLHLSSAILPQPLPSIPGTYLLLRVPLTLRLLQKRQPPPRSTSCSAKKKETGFTDQILDYIEGGPKLRKWYGAPDLPPKDGDPDAGEDGEEETDEVRDAVLVTDGESEIGQMVILSLIVKQARVKALVKDKRAAVDAFGSYIEPIVGDASSISFLKKAFRGVRAVICPSNLAAYKGSSGFQALMNNKARKLAEQDEEAVVSSGIPYTIIRAALLQNTPGGNQGFSFKEGVASTGRLSEEDAALICVEALDAIPQKGVVFEGPVKRILEKMAMADGRYDLIKKEKNCILDSVSPGQRRLDSVDRQAL
ncbi:hypothetical protein Taro_052835, partial [Colocasia esculenta]|nr:hypothetical protein [Colocasia esculenta]